MAGTNKRRWHSVGGKDKAAQECSGADVLDSVSGSSGTNELVAALSGADLVVPTGETDSDGAKFEVLWSGSSGEDDLGSSMSEVPLPGALGEDVLNGTKSEVLHGEDTSGGDVFEVLRSGANELGSTKSVVLGQPAHRVAGTTCGLAGSGVGRRRRAAQRRSVGVPAASAPPLVGGMRAVRPAQRAEAGSDGVHSFVSSFERCETHIARSHRVNVTLHENLLSTSSGCRTACTTHNSLACDTGVHDAMQRASRLGRNSGNSSNSWRDTEEGGLHFCVLGGAKSPSMSTWCRVRRSAVDEFAHTQQAPLKLHEEM